MQSQVDKDIIETIKTKAVPILIDLLESPKGDKDKHYFMMEFGKIDALKAVEFLARASLEPYSLSYWHDALDTISVIAFNPGLTGGVGAATPRPYRRRSSAS